MEEIEKVQLSFSSRAQVSGLCSKWFIDEITRIIDNTVETRVSLELVNGRKKTVKVKETASCHIVRLLNIVSVFADLFCKTVSVVGRERPIKMSKESKLDA